MRIGLASALTLTACAHTASICPPGTRPGGASPPHGRARWCQSTARTLDIVPTPGRSVDSTLGLSRPTAMRGGVEGPYTGWYPDGTLEMHGRYETRGTTSVPHGVWGFWYPSGGRRALGLYRDGEPVGCFATWDEDGTPRTAIIEGDHLRSTPCKPPPDDEMLAVEGGSLPETPPPVSWDLAIQGYAASGGIGARSELQRDRHPDLAMAFSLGVRKRLGPLRAGVAASKRISWTDDYGAYAAAGLFAVAIPGLPPRLDLELGAELGVQRLHVVAQQPVAQRPLPPGRAELDFWAPLLAGHLTLAYALSPLLEVTLGARLDGAPTNDHGQWVQYCFDICTPPEWELWYVGGWTYGAAAGVRLLFR